MMTLPHLQQNVVSIGKLIKAMFITVQDKQGNWKTLRGLKIKEKFVGTYCIGSLLATKLLHGLLFHEEITQLEPLLYM